MGRSANSKSSSRPEPLDFGPALPPPTFHAIFMPHLISHRARHVNSLLLHLPLLAPPPLLIDLHLNHPPVHGQIERNAVVPLVVPHTSARPPARAPPRSAQYCARVRRRVRLFSSLSLSLGQLQHDDLVALVRPHDVEARFSVCGRARGRACGGIGGALTPEELDHVPHGAPREAVGLAAPHGRTAALDVEGQRLRARGAAVIAVAQVAYAAVAAPAVELAPLALAVARHRVGDHQAGTFAATDAAAVASVVAGSVLCRRRRRRGRVGERQQHAHPVGAERRGCDAYPPPARGGDLEAAAVAPGVRCRLLVGRRQEGVEAEWRSGDVECELERCCAVVAAVAAVAAVAPVAPVAVATTTAAAFDMAEPSESFGGQRHKRPARVQRGVQSLPELLA